MVVILEAVAGPVTGRQIEVKPGTILRIGRTARSDYALGEDSYLSGQHFAVENDGAQCRIRDLGSSNGTFVNGNKIVEHVVQEGDSLVAGGSTFTLHLQTNAAAATVPSFTRTAPTPVYTTGQVRDLRTVAIPTTGAPPQGSATWPGYSKPQGSLLTNLFGKGEGVFAVLDAMRDSRIPAFLDASGEPFYPIDPSGRAQAYVAAVVPTSKLLDVIVKDGWGRGWCSFFLSTSGLQAVCAHLCSYVTLYTAHAQPFTLRFWDPRVLRALAPLMTAEEAGAFFGPLSRIVFESERPEMALEFAITPRGPYQQTIVLL